MHVLSNHRLYPLKMQSFSRLESISTVFSLLAQPALRRTGNSLSTQMSHSVPPFLRARFMSSHDTQRYLSESVIYHTTTASLLGGKKRQNFGLSSCLEVCTCVCMACKHAYIGVFFSSLGKYISDSYIR